MKWCSFIVIDSQSKWSIRWKEKQTKSMHVKQSNRISIFIFGGWWTNTHELYDVMHIYLWCSRINNQYPYFSDFHFHCNNINWCILLNFAKRKSVCVTIVRRDRKYTLDRSTIKIVKNTNYRGNDAKTTLIKISLFRWDWFCSNAFKRVAIRINPFDFISRSLSNAME